MQRLRATYLVRSTAAEIEARAAALAVEQSVEMPLDAIAQPHILRDVVARVSGIEPCPRNGGPERFEVHLDLATATIGGDFVQLLNMTFGNCSLQGDVELVDLDLDLALERNPSLLSGPQGPRHGIDGLRRLVGADDGRALTCTALKPQGLSPDELARLAATFAGAGIDLIKDDHGLANQGAAPFDRRVVACQRAVREANDRTGGSSRYAPSLVGGPLQVARQARVARDEGVEVVLVAPMLVGLGAFAELVAEGSGGGLDGLAVLAHPAFAGAGAIAAPLLMGTLFRLAGADAVIFTNHGGRFAVSEASCASLADRARRPWGALRAALPVPAGGMTPSRVDELVRFYGNDVALLIGGALLQARDDLEEAARAFVAATRAASAVASAAASTAGVGVGAGSGRRGREEAVVMEPGVRRAGPDGAHWDGVEVLEYKAQGGGDAEAPFRTVTRQVLFEDEALACQWRYFEVAPGGWSTLEQHDHVHAVLVLRGGGRCLVGTEVTSLGAHDLVSVPAATWHQFRADAEEPLGFLCLVNAERDRPRLPTPDELAALRAASPEVADFLRP